MTLYKEKITDYKWVIGFDIENEPNKKYRWEITSTDKISNSSIDKVIKIRYEDYLKYNATL